MATIIRGAVIYLFLMGIFRLAGRRTLHEISAFDIVLLLIISESIQQAMIGPDNSLVNALLLVSTLVGIDIFFSVITSRYPRLGRLANGEPIVVLARGSWYESRMKRLRVSRDDVLSAARELQGIVRADEILYAVVENNGAITIVPRPDAAS